MRIICGFSEQLGGIHNVHNHSENTKSLNYSNTGSKRAGKRPPRGKHNAEKRAERRANDPSVQERRRDFESTMLELDELESAIYKDREQQQREKG